MRLTGSLPPCRVEKLWVQNGATFFFGPIFIHPEETAHEPTKMFYKKEVFLSNLEETLPMTCVLGTTRTRTRTRTDTDRQVPLLLSRCFSCEYAAKQKSCRIIRKITSSN